MSEIAALILAIAVEADVDGGLALAVALMENPALEAGKVGVSGDLGIMQLNPKYISYFVDKYWNKPGEFDWRNPGHNIYIGVRHLKYLLTVSDFNYWQAIMAYNCGERAVRSGKPPAASIEYANAVYAAWRGKS